jgi:hypothetical protein
VPARSGPVREARQAAKPAREPLALRKSALPALVPAGDVEAGCPERVPERAEAVPVVRLRMHRRAARIEIRASGNPPELLAQSAELAEQLIARREPPGNEPGATLRRAPASEPTDDRLGVDACARVSRELSHRRRPAEPHGRPGQLGEEVLVGVPLWHVGLRPNSRRAG